jgi:hypothetical protein
MVQGIFLRLSDAQVLGRLLELLLSCRLVVVLVAGHCLIEPVLVGVEAVVSVILLMDVRSVLTACKPSRG